MSIERFCVAALLSSSVCAVASAQLIETNQLQRVRSALKAERVDVLSLDVPADLPAECAVETMMDGLPVTLHLQKHSLRAPGFRLRMETDAGSWTVVPPPVSTYRGVLAGHPESTVAASLIRGQLVATVHVPGEGLWIIQPLSGLIEGADPQHHVAYWDTDIATGDWQCGATATADAAIPRAAAGSAASSGLPTNVLIAYDADWEYYVLNGMSVENTCLDIETTTNAVDAIYNAELGITYTISEIIVQESSSDPYSATECSSLRAEFRDHWNATHSDITRDVAHLMTGKDLDGSVIGCAWIGPMCANLSQAYGLSQSMYVSSFNDRVGLTAHELGHNWDAHHCSSLPPCSTYDADCAIMCACIGDCSKDLFTFGASATAEIVAHRDSVSCIGSACLMAKCGEDDIVVVNESCPDGILHSGDDVDAVIALVNIGPIDAQHVHANLGPFSHPGIFLNDPTDTLHFGDLPAGTGFCVFATAGDWDICTVKSLPEGTYCADILITCEGAVEPYVIPNGFCLDVAAQAWLRVLPEDADFGVIGTNTAFQVNATVSNVGSAPLTVSGVNHVFGPQILDCSVSPLPGTWGPGGDGVIPPGFTQNIVISMTTSSTQGAAEIEVIISAPNACFVTDADDHWDRIIVRGLVSDGPVVFCVPGAIGGHPGVSGNIVVWSSNVNEDIFGHDLATNQTFPISTHPEEQRGPIICGDLVVWNDLRDWDGIEPKKFHVYAYDLNTQTEFALITDPDPTVDIRAFGCSGVDYVGFIKSYHEIAKPSSPDFAYNISVWDLNFNVEIPCTTFTWPGGFAPFETVVGAGAVSVGGGTVVWEEATYAWSGNDWDSVDRRIRKHQFATGLCTPWGGPCFPSAPVQILDHGTTSSISADSCRVAFGDSTPDDEQIFIWRECASPNIIQITFDLVHPRFNPLLCGNYVFHIKGANPDWLMYTDLTDMSEHIIVQNDPGDAEDCDGQLVVWTEFAPGPGDAICFTYIETPEISISPGAIDISPDMPFDIDPIDIIATVHNLAPVDAVGPIAVQFYDGDPDMGGTLLCEVSIPGPLPGQSSVQVMCNTILSAGDHDICVRVIAPDDGHPGNNKACVNLVVGATGACCLQDGTCQLATKPLECFDADGAYLGDGSSCPDLGCPVTIGACCLSGVCMPDLKGDDCTMQGGTYQGDGTTCSNSPPTCCPWDCGSPPDGDVGIVDFLTLLAQWGGPGSCDFSGDMVDIVDFLDLLAHWGACP